MSSLMHKPTGPTLEGQTANLRRQATANPTFKPDFRRSVSMHPVLAGCVAAVVFVLVIAAALTQKPAYYAESLIYIEPFNSKVLADQTNGAFDSSKYDSSVAQQMLTAQRADIITTALGTLPKPMWAAYGSTAKAAAGNLQGQLKVGRVGSSYQVSIGLKGPDPANTTAIVNAITTAYLEAGRKDEISQADQRSQLLSEERGRIEAELAKTRAEQTQLGTQLGIANPGTSGLNPYDSQLDALRQQLIQARASHDQAAAQLAAISGVNASHASGLTAAANEVIGADPGLGSMKSTINQRRAQLASKMADMKPANPEYQAAQDELADLDKTLESMTVQLRDRAARQLQDKLRTDLERSSDVEGRLNSELGRQTAAATTASPRLQRAAELNADVQRLTTRYASVDNALHSLQLETTGPGMAHLALAASVPAGPEPSKQRLLLLAALPLALFAGLAAAVFARKRDHRVYTGADVDEVLGFAPIAILPARGEVSDDVMDEYYLRLAAGVEGAYRGSNARTFVITPVSNETDVAPLIQALDNKLVELGLGVVVVKAETVFDQHHEAPATSTEVAGYDPAFDRHFEGLAASLFTRMKAEHDVILLHSPALLISAQTEYVARCSDVTLMVAESAVTTRGELFQAGVLLQRLNITGVGSVLEELQLRNADSAFIRGVRALEGRTRPARRERPAAEPVKPAPTVYEEPIAYTEPVVEAQAPAVRRAPVVVKEDPLPEPEAISVEPAGHAWYPVHAVTVEEPHVPQAELSEPVVQAVAAEPVVIAEPIEAEHTAPMALFDSTDSAPERRKTGSLLGSSQASEPEPEEEAAPARGWFQRIFKREPEQKFSIIPDISEDDEEETSAAPVMAYDESRYDLPLPVAATPAAASDWAPAAQEAPVPQPVAVPEPVAELEPVPEFAPAVVAPVAVPYYLAPAAVAAPIELVPEVPVAAIVQEPAPVPTKPYVAPAPSPESSAIYAFSPQAVAPQALPKAAPAPAPAYIAEPPQPVQVARAIPARPLSFRELHQQHEPIVPEPAALRQPEPPMHFEATPEPEQYFEAAVEPEPAPRYTSEPEQHFDTAPEPPYTAPEPPALFADDWNPAPLNRWDPIPPLRQQEPWRISSGSIRAAQQQAPTEVWRGQDPVRIPPADRWVSAESVPAEAPPAESNDVVLTRRWGLLSRFQQGESFQTAQASRRATPAAAEEEYDNEYDRPRR